MCSGEPIKPVLKVFLLDLLVVIIIAPTMAKSKIKASIIKSENKLLYNKTPIVII